MKLCGCHSEIKIKTITLFENPFYTLAALNKKHEYPTRFHTSYRVYYFLEFKPTYHCFQALRRLPFI